MAEIPQEFDFLTWTILNFVRRLKRFVKKIYTTWLIDLANKLYDLGKVLIPFYVICY